MVKTYSKKYSKKNGKNHSKKTINNCPNCGGSIEPGTTTCEHCKAVIVQDSNEFVMSSKRRV